MSLLDHGAVRVRHVLADEHDLLRQLRLASLGADPHAFGSTHAREASESTQWWKRWAAQSEDGTTQRTFVLVDANDRWLGLTLVRLADAKPRSAVLNAMWVTPETRGRRAAGQLCDASAAWAADRGCHELTLIVMVDNRPAQHAYEAAGFAICGETTRSRDGQTLDEFVMVRSL